MLRECPSIFSAEGDATLHDPYSDTTLFVSTVQKQVGGGDGIISCSHQEMVLLTFSPMCI
jgi:hypothetical protein